MNFTVTIPGVFYDLIARVVPGFYTLILYRLVGTARGWQFTDILPPTPDPLANGQLLRGASFLMACYVIGWLLRGVASLVHTQRWSQPRPPQFLDAHYHDIRIRDQELGYRLLKGRAEATMLEGFLMATLTLPIVIVSGDVYCGRFGATVNRPLQLTSLFVVGLVAVAWFAATRRSWKRYHDSVEINHGIVGTQGSSTAQPPVDSTAPPEP
jgi:hypothetical protein